MGPYSIVPGRCSSVWANDPDYSQTSAYYPEGSASYQAIHVDMNLTSYELQRWIPYK